MNLNLRKTASDLVTLSELDQFYKGSIDLMWDEGLLDEILSKMLFGFEDAAENMWVEADDPRMDLWLRQVEGEINALRHALSYAYQDARKKMLAINRAMMTLHENLHECANWGEEPFPFWKYVVPGELDLVLDFFNSTGLIRDGLYIRGGAGGES